jgi:hypothetical protein
VSAQLKRRLRGEKKKRVDIGWLGDSPDVRGCNDFQLPAGNAFEGAGSVA